MLEFQEKIKVKKIAYSKVTLIILVIFLVVLLKAVWNIYQKEDIARANLDKAAINFNELKEREAVLISEIQRLNTDKGVEEELREKYGLVKPGEEVITIVDTDEKKNVDEIKTEKGFWQKIVEWFR